MITGSRPVQAPMESVGRGPGAVVALPGGLVELLGMTVVVVAAGAVVVVDAADVGGLAW